MKIHETKTIYIVSGEGGVPLHWELFAGKRTARAVKSRLTRERCNGERSAFAVQYSHSNEWGYAGVDLETGNWVTIPESVLETNPCLN